MKSITSSASNPYLELILKVLKSTEPLILILHLKPLYLNYNAILNLNFTRPLFMVACKFSNIPCKLVDF